MSRFTTFLRRPRNFALAAVTSAGLVFSYKAGPHLLPDYLYRPIFEAYKAGKRINLIEAQQREFQEVCKDLKIDPLKYNTFATSRWEVKSVGLQWLPAGCHVGIPVSLVSDPDLSKLRFSGPIKANMDTREGTWLTDSLKMSRNARKFAIGHQVALSNSNLPLYSMVLAPTVTLVGFATTFVVQTLSPIVPVYVTGLALGTCFYFLYGFAMGVVNERTDLKVNHRLANISEEYAMGGLEFCEKLLQKNRALRKLLGARGEQLYTYYGNETPGLVYSSGASNVQKRDILKKIVEELENNKRAKAQEEES